MTAHTGNRTTSNTQTPPAKGAYTAIQAPIMALIMLASPLLAPRKHSALVGEDKGLAVDCQAGKSRRPPLLVSTRAFPIREEQATLAVAGSFLPPNPFLSPLFLRPNVLCDSCTPRVRPFVRGRLSAALWKNSKSLPQRARARIGQGLFSYQS